MFSLLFSILIFFHFPSIGTTYLEKHKAFSEYQKKQKTIEGHKRKALKNRLKNKKKQTLTVKNTKSFFNHKKKQNELKKKRAKSFLFYKKKYASYKNKRKHILETRLKVLKKLRKQNKPYLKNSSIDPIFQ